MYLAASSKLSVKTHPPAKKGLGGVGRCVYLDTASAHPVQVAILLSKVSRQSETRAVIAPLLSRYSVFPRGSTVRFAMRLFVPLVLNACAAFAAPFGDASARDDTPLCGYVRMEDTAWWSVGLQTHGRCEPIYNNETAAIYRIDRERCGCAFFLLVKSF